MKRSIVSHIIHRKPTAQNSNEHETDEVGQSSRSSAMPHGRRPYTHVRRELNETELSSPGAIRLLLDNLDQLELEVNALKRFQNDFHRVEKEAAILREKLNGNIATEVIYGVALATGFGLIGIVGNLWEKQPYGKIVMWTAVILIIGGIAVKVIKR